MTHQRSPRAAAHAAASPATPLATPVAPAARRSHSASPTARATDQPSSGRAGAPQPSAARGSAPIATGARARARRSATTSASAASAVQQPNNTGARGRGPALVSVTGPDERANAVDARPRDRPATFDSLAQQCEWTAEVFQYNSDGLPFLSLMAFPLPIPNPEHVTQVVTLSMERATHCNFLNCLKRLCNRGGFLYGAWMCNIPHNALTAPIGDVVDVVGRIVELCQVDDRHPFLMIQVVGTIKVRRPIEAVVKRHMALLGEDLASVPRFTDRIYHYLLYHDSDGKLRAAYQTHCRLLSPARARRLYGATDRQVAALMPPPTPPPPLPAATSTPAVRTPRSRRPRSPSTRLEEERRHQPVQPAPVGPPPPSTPRLEEALAGGSLASSESTTQRRSRRRVSHSAGNESRRGALAAASIASTIDA